MHFLDLNYDVLLRTFAFLDVTSLVRCTEVCSAFQRLAKSKHVWLAVVQNLAHRSLLSLPARPTLLDYSATQLVDEVKRAVVGPSTWAQTSSCAPAVHRHVHVSMPTSDPSSTFSTCEGPGLLLGDRHLLVQRGPGCEIWDVIENRRVWAREVLRSQMHAQAIKNGTEIAIAVWLRRNEVQVDFKVVVHLLLLDLDTNSEMRLPPIPLPRSFYYFADVVMADDFWTADIQWDDDCGHWKQGVLIVNWRDSTFVLLHLGRRLPHKKLLPGHLLAVTRTSTAWDVVLYPFTAFTWQPLSTVTLAEASNSALTVQPIVLQQAEYPILLGCPSPLLSVHECPLKHGLSYVVSTYMASIAILPADSDIRQSTSLYRYRLTLPSQGTSDPPRWKKISSAGLINCVFMHSLTYAGYGLGTLRNGTRRILLCRPAAGEHVQEEQGLWGVPLPVQHNFGDAACLSPYTGALAVCSDGGADVYYYE
ncbi:hypothetical protein C8R45DRAFT_1192820 [Mycena sanguinolenta]|nr:hypothetical protein C8R45DRAFT_1192820 [Mycena sanguinolenta]